MLEADEDGLHDLGLGDRRDDLSSSPAFLAAQNIFAEDSLEKLRPDD